MDHDEPGDNDYSNNDHNKSKDDDNNDNNYNMNTFLSNCTKLSKKPEHKSWESRGLFAESAVNGYDINHLFLKTKDENL